MDLPPGSHIIYIPMILLIGIVLGFIVGSRAAHDAANLAVRRDAERTARKAARKARLAANNDAKAAPGQDLKAEGATGD